jgi:hypothetical protein
VIGDLQLQPPPGYDRFAEAVDPPMLVTTILWLPVLIVPLVTPVHGSVAQSLSGDRSDGVGPCSLSDLSSALPVL